MYREAALNRFHIPPDLFRGKRVLVAAYLTRQGVEVGSQGDSPTIKSLMQAIEEQGGKADYLSYSELGAMGLLIRYMERLKQNSIADQISGSETRWVYTATFHLLTHILSRIDRGMIKKIEHLKESHYDAFILFYPYLFTALERQMGSVGRSTKILFEANIEARFFEFQFSGPKLHLLKTLLVRLVDLMEKRAISQSDAIMTVAVRDAKELSTRFGSKRVFTLPQQGANGVTMKEKKEFVRVKDVFRMKNSNLGPDILKVTFMGSNYSLNVRSVEELIVMARSMSECKDKIKFIVVGNIHRAFDDNFELPENVIFTGYLRDFNEVMCASDFFILFDRMGTGVESKCRVYSEYPGLTLALTSDSEEYLPILKDKMISFDSVESIESFLRDFSFGRKNHSEMQASTKVTLSHT